MRRVKLVTWIAAAAILFPFAILLLVGQISGFITISWWWFAPLVPLYLMMIVGSGLSTVVMLIAFLGMFGERERERERVDKEKIKEH